MDEELVFTFERRADEYVDAAFAASFRLQGGRGPWWMPSKSGVLTWVVVFFVILGAMQLAENGMFGANTVFAFVIGAVVGLAAMFGVMMSAQSGLARKMKAVVKEGSPVTTRLGSDGVYSNDEIADIRATWDEVHMIWVDNDLLHLMGDMFVHIIPARALKSGQSIEALHQKVLKMRDAYAENSSQ